MKGCRADSLPKGAASIIFLDEDAAHDHGISGRVAAQLRQAGVRLAVVLAVALLLRFSRCFPATLLIPIARGEAPTAAMTAMVAYLDVIAHQELRASERKSEVPSSEIELYI